MSRKNALPRTAVVVVAGLLAVGCASTPSEGPSTGRTRIDTGTGTYDVELTHDRSGTQHIVRAPVDSVWRALPEVYAALGLNGGVVNAALHEFGIPRFTLAPRRLAGQRLSRLLACGSTAMGDNADRYEVRYVLVSTLSADPEGTEVGTRLEANATARSVSGSAIECASNGVLEQMLADSLNARMGALGGGR